MQIKAFYEDLTAKEKVLDPIELAAWTHAEFVRIHPFADGNGIKTAGGRGFSTPVFRIAIKAEAVRLRF